MHEFFGWTLALLAGICFGFSIGIAFKPKYKQPLNLTVQLTVAAFGFILMGILFHHLEIISNFLNLVSQ